MRHKERIDVNNIKEKEIVKVVSIGQKDVRFRLQNAYVGQVGENTELLDETLVDNMLELMAKAVKTRIVCINIKFCRRACSISYTAIGCKVSGIK